MQISCLLQYTVDVSDSCSNRDVNCRNADVSLSNKCYLLQHHDVGHVGDRARTHVRVEHED